MFEVDDKSIKAFKLLSFKVSFALTSVVLGQGKASMAKTPKVEKEDDMSNHVVH